MGTQDLSIFAHDDLDKAFRFSDGDSLADGGPRETLDSHLWILLASGGLCQTDRGDLGEGLKRIGDDIVVHGDFMSGCVIGCYLAFG